MKSRLIGKFPGKRGIKVGLRTLHLIAIAGVAGGILLSQPAESWQLYWHLALISGACMMLLDLASNFIWCVQVRGVAIYLKMALLLMLGADPYWDKVIVISMIGISGIISHASGNVRYYSLWHRKRIDDIADTKG